MSKEPSKNLLDVFTKMKSGLTESLLVEFLSLTKSSENVKNIVSVNHAIVAREPGVSKPLTDVGTSFQKGNF